VQLSPKIDEQELIEILRSLNSTNNKRLPPKFVIKQEARSQGWRPGKDLWSVSTLRGASIGGDRFKNLEGRLPRINGARPTLTTRADAGEGNASFFPRMESGL